MAITIIKGQKKEKKIEINLIDEKAIFMEHFLASIFRFIKIRCMNCFFEIGNSKNAQIASMGSGLFLTFMYSLYGMLFTLKGEFECILGAEMTVDENKLKLSNKTSIMCMPIMILIGYIRAKLRTRRVVKIYERFRKR